jgi:hypothetical protein
VSAIGLDIVFPFGKMSTDSDQAQERFGGGKGDKRLYSPRGTPVAIVRTIFELAGRPFRSGRKRRREISGKDPALILRADNSAPVFNDEEKRARATT